MPIPYKEPVGQVNPLYQKVLGLSKACNCRSPFLETVTSSLASLPRVDFLALVIDIDNKLYN